METYTPSRLEDDVKKALVVYRPGQFQVSKVSRIGLVMEIPQPGVVSAPMDWLTIHLSLVPGNSGGDLTSIDSNGLCHRVLALHKSGKD